MKISARLVFTLSLVAAVIAGSVKAQKDGCGSTPPTHVLEEARLEKKQQHHVGQYLHRIGFYNPTSDTQIDWHKLHEMRSAKLAYTVEATRESCGETFIQTVTCPVHTHLILLSSTTTATSLTTLGCTEDTRP